MARIRTIKPEFPQSESMGRVGRESRLCFILLFTLADDAGRLRGNSRMLASLLYPYDDDAKKHIDTWLSELHTEGCIVRYEIDGDQYIQINKWLQHQKIDRPSESKIPAFDEASRILANVSADSRNNMLYQGRDQGVDQGAADAFETVYNAYPRKAGKPAALKAWKAAKIKTAEVAMILSDIESKSCSDDWQKDNGKYIPHPATYFNQRRWEDSQSTGSTAASSMFAGAI